MWRQYCLYTAGGTERLQIDRKNPRVLIGPQWRTDAYGRILVNTLGYRLLYMVRYNSKYLK